MKAIGDRARRQTRVFVSKPWPTAPPAKRVETSKSISNIYEYVAFCGVNLDTKIQGFQLSYMKKKKYRTTIQGTHNINKWKYTRLEEEIN